MSSDVASFLSWEDRTCVSVVSIRSFGPVPLLGPQLQRPGVEDVAVLKRELIQVQTLMDNMTREREEESERLKRQFAQLQADYSASQVTPYWFHWPCVRPGCGCP